MPTPDLAAWRRMLMVMLAAFSPPVLALAVLAAVAVLVPHSPAPVVPCTAGRHSLNSGAS